MGEGPLTDHNSPISDRDDSAETRKKRRGKLLFYIIFSHILFLTWFPFRFLDFFLQLWWLFFCWLMKNLEIIVNIEYMVTAEVSNC